MSTETDEFETDAREHRAALREDLDAIFERLSPGQIMEEALGQMGGVKTLTTNLGAQIRDHPMPVIVTAAGLAWLITSSRNAKSGGANASSAGMQAEPMANGVDHGRVHVAVDPDDYDADVSARRIEIAEAACVRMENEQDEEYEDRLAKCRAHVLELQRADGETDTGFRQRVSDTAKSAREKADGARQRITDGAAKARKGLGHAAGSVKHGVQNVSGAAMGGARSSMHSAASLHESSPLATGAIALAVGALIGALLPLTRQEEAVYAEPADKASEAMAGVAKKAADATHEAREEISGSSGDAKGPASAAPSTNGAGRKGSTAPGSVAPPPPATSR